MALADLISNVANKAGYKVASTVIGANDTTTKQLLALLQSLNQEVMELYDWPQLVRSATITLVAGQSQYDVADDFSHHHYDTFWDQSQRWPLYGPLSNQEYADINGYGLDAFPVSNFIITGVIDKKIEIVPTPTSAEAGETVYYLYQSARYVRPITWEQGLVFAAGDYCHYGNNYYIADGAGTAGATPPTHTTGTASDGTITWEYTDNPYTTFLKDTDTPILKQRILEQGLEERYGTKKSIDDALRFDKQVIDEYRRLKPGHSICTSRDSGSYTFGAGGKFYFGTRL